jgi:catechol 2,3-dioxygenase-like lactoylglutathione lyase family enzyme
MGRASTVQDPSTTGPAVQALAVHHVSINVDDVDAALAFYVDALGFTVRTDRPDFGFAGAWLDVGGQQVHLIAGDVPERLGQHYAVQVADLDAAVAALRARDIRISDPSEVGTGLQSFTRDPSGNMVELHEAGGVARRAATTG